MRLTKFEFGKLLRNKVENEQDLVSLSRWAYQLYLENSRNLEPGLKDLLLDLGRMADVPEFEYTITELSELAEALTNGKH